MWYHLQGKDRKEALEKYLKDCEKNNKEVNKKQRFNAEVKLHICYEGWYKYNAKHKLVNKKIISGMMSSKKLKELNNARIYQEYDVNKILLRASNGDRC